MRKIVVTGATGYIGHKLIEKLLQEGSNYIYAVVREDSNIRIEENDNLEYVFYDGTEISLVDCISDSESIIHLGALYSTKTDPETTIDLINSNILFSTQIFNVANTYNKNISIVSASTFSQLSETLEYSPATLYAATKKAVEVIAEYYKDLSINFVTLPDTYGPGDWRNKVHNLAMKSPYFEFRSPKNQEISLLYIEDVLGHLLSISNVKYKGTHFYDIYATGTKLTLEELAPHICKGNYKFLEINDLVLLPAFERQTSEYSGYENQYINIKENFDEIRKSL